MLNAATQQRKPRIALMGEFSAGKSTLTNLLLGARPLPERVTATRLSPVWISGGAPAAEREHLDGTRTPISVEEIADVPIDDTRVIRLSFEAEMLDMFDLIDCPGISDPNMPVEVWERLVPEIDAVLWCTHATQAWRQSEATVWETIPEDVRARSLLLITRFDKLKTERDRARVVARVRHETDGQFAGIFPIALLQALNAGDDEEAWAASGAHDFTEALIETITELQETGLEDRAPTLAAPGGQAPGQGIAAADPYAPASRPVSTPVPKPTEEARAAAAARISSRVTSIATARPNSKVATNTGATSRPVKDPLVLKSSQKIVPLPTQGEPAQPPVDSLDPEAQSGPEANKPRRVTLSGTRRSRRPKPSVERPAQSGDAEDLLAKPAANPSMGELRAALWDKDGATK